MADKSIRRPHLFEVCGFLRTKSMFLPGDDGKKALTEPSDTAVYWCNRTGGATGPDHEIAGPKICGEHRGCYLASRLLMPEAPAGVG